MKWMRDSGRVLVAAACLFGAVSAPPASLAQDNAPSSLETSGASQPPRVDSPQISGGKLVNRKVTVKGTVEKLIEASDATVLYLILDDYAKPIYVRTTLGRPERHREYLITGVVLKDTDPRIEGGYYVLAESQERTVRPGEPGGEGPPKPKPPGEPSTGPEQPAEEPAPWPLYAGVGAALVAAVILAALLFRPRRSSPAAGNSRGRSTSLTEAVSSVTGIAAAPLRSETVASQQAGAPAPRPRTATQVQWGIMSSAADPSRIYPLVGERLPLGRDHGTVAMDPEDAAISGSHGLLLWEAGQAFYEDTSTNGSMVNGERVHRKRVPLADGARIRIGRSDWLVAIHAPAASARPPRAPTMVDASMTIAPAPGTAEFHRAELVVISGPDEGKKAPVFGGKVTIGRSEDQLFRLEHGTVSRAHAVLSYDTDRFLLKNLSSQGTRLNGEPIDEVELQGGEEFEVGADTIRFVRHI